MKDYTGVRWISEKNKWQAMIRHKGVTHNCGLHVEQKDAILARDTMIINRDLNVALQILKPLKKTRNETE